MSTRSKTWSRKGTAVAILALSCTAGAVAVSASPGSAVTVRPPRASSAAATPNSARVRVSFPAYKNKLNRNTNGWCTVAQGCNGQGGNGSYYGTIDILPHTYSNYGGYAASVPGPGGQSKYARVTGAGLEQDTAAGCPTPGYDASLNLPYCQGPYVCYLGTCAASAFPTNGFSTSIKIYIDPAWAAAHPGQNLDWDVGLNNTSGNYLNDNGFTTCTTAAGGGGFYLSLNQFSSCNPTSEELTTPGWYTFSQNFQPVAGNLVVTYSVTPPSGPVWSSVVDTGLPIATTGGPSYLWFADEDVLGLPVAQISLKKN